MYRIKKIGKRISAVSYKQFIDFTRNKKMLLIFFIFPILYIVLKVVAGKEFGSDGSSFILMHSILVPLLITATIVAEEKEKGTLKLLIMSGVKAYEYFIGIAFSMMGFIIAGMLLFELSGATSSFDAVFVALFTILADIISMFIGAVIGRITANQTNVGPIAVPVTLLIFFAPMLQQIKPEFTFLSKYLYSGILLKIMSTCTYSHRDIFWMGVNFAMILILFLLVFNTKNLIKSVSHS